VLNDLLLSFFFGMPAVVAPFLAADLRNPASHFIMFWGGIAFTVLVATVVIPMLLCDGSITAAYSNCVGGTGLATAFTSAQPVIRASAFAYIMVGPPLAILAYLLEWLYRRQRAA